MVSNLSRIALCAGVAMLLTDCKGGGGSASNPTTSAVTTVTTAPVTAPTTTVVSGTSVDVNPCFNQTVAGRSVASLVVPDVLTLNMNQASGFPNGRKLLDPVIDLELAALFLDLSVHPVDTLAKLPLNPSGNDVALPTGFPYLGDPHGGVAIGGGGGFNFRTDLAAAYRRVDRMGEPAVATALVRSAQKTAFNDDSPVNDVTGKWVPEFAGDLTELANALKDDFASAGLKTCAKPI